LASGIAHDLNNVLAPIGMALQLFRMRFLDASTQNTLNVLDGCVDRGAGLIRQILTFARGVHSEHLPVQTRSLLLDAEKVLIQTFSKLIAIRTDFPQDLWMVSADSTQLHQVLMNLCINARDAMQEGGTLTITARNAVLDETYVRMNPERSPGPYVVIEVQDTGHGMPADIQEKIFEPFFTTKELGQGTGLGLSTVAAIVRNHGGFIDLHSAVDRGTSFKIYFPALPGQEKQGGAAAKAAVPVGSGELILIVEDEPAVRDIGKLVLEAHGYRVIHAKDGAEGVAMFAQHADEIRLVISDMDMPVMNGAGMIRSLERINPNVRVISASGLASNGGTSRNSSDASRYRAVLSKPYTAGELLRTVADIINAA
jgi:CheY-like chemotaxis protein